MTSNIMTFRTIYVLSTENKSIYLSIEPLASEHQQPEGLFSARLLELIPWFAFAQQFVSSEVHSRMGVLCNIFCQLEISVNELQIVAIIADLSNSFGDI
jgi:hypothetical protein